MWQRFGTKLAILILVLSVGLTWPLLGYIKPEDKCYALDEKTMKMESGNMVTDTNHVWLPFMTPIAFDTKICDPSIKQGNTNGKPCGVLSGLPPASYVPVALEGYLEYGLYNVDNNPMGAPGFQSSRNWRICACDRNRDGSFDNADRQMGFRPNTPANDPADWYKSYIPEQDVFVTGYTYTDAQGVSYTYTYPNSGWVLVATPNLQDNPVPCTSGNCQTEIVTTIYVTLDKDGAGGLPADAIPPSGLCFYAEGRKPYTTTPMWGGNVQSRVSSTSGEKTLNFSFQAPTPVIISSFTAYHANGQAVLQWETSSEQKTMGFDLYREENGNFVQVNQEPLPNLEDAIRGGIYRYVDTNAFPGQTYIYRLSELQADGGTRAYGPFTVTFGEPKGPPPGYVDGYEMKQRPIPPETRERLANAKASKEQGLALAKGRTGEVVKIFVQKTGLYYVSAQEIASIFATPVQRVTGLIKTGNLSLSCQGKEVAWLAAENDAGLYFYGEGIDSLYTTDNVYWLRSLRGQTMAAINGSTPVPSSDPLVFTDTLHFEKDATVPWALVHDSESDYWMWTPVSGTGTRTLNFRTPGASGTGSASLTLRLYGGSDAPGSPDQIFTVKVNTAWLGQQGSSFDGIGPFQVSLPVTASLLKSTADNSLTIKRNLSTGRFYVDSFDLTYQRLYQAVSDSLALRGDGNRVVTVSGFTSAQILVFDVSVPTTPKQVSATKIDSYGGSYRVSFTPASPSSRYYVVASPAIGRAVSLVGDVPSNLRQKSNAADYLIIAPGQFKAGAQALADYRSERGLASMVVDIEDIYDEFANGLVDPHAIRSFLGYAASQWRTAPRYVVLAGDASMDFKNVFQGEAGENFVPTVLVDTDDGLTSSDGALADIYGQDGIGDIAIGRLPVVSNSELEQVVAKIKAYERADGPWKGEVLMAADYPDSAAGDFKADSEEIRKELPASIHVDTVYLSDMGGTAAKVKMLDGINNGAGLVTYFGHGDQERIGSTELLSQDDVRKIDPATSEVQWLLTNGDRLPVVAAMTCAVGWFDFGDCLAESLVLSPNGGAVAVWSASGWSYNPEAKALAQGFVQGFFSQETLLGNIVQSAVDGYASHGGVKPFMPKMYNLLGDPALEVW